MMVWAIPVLVYSVAFKERLTPTKGPVIVARRTNNMVLLLFAEVNNTLCCLVSMRAVVKHTSPVTARMKVALMGRASATPSTLEGSNVA